MISFLSKQGESLARTFCIRGKVKWYDIFWIYLVPIAGLPIFVAVVESRRE